MATRPTTARDLESARERVLAFASEELRRGGVPFDELSFTPASDDAYDGLVLVWHGGRARTAAVRLPQAA
jgi:hypothetical protein